jgi:hypothetical protein
VGFRIFTLFPGLAPLGSWSFLQHHLRFITFRKRCLQPSSETPNNYGEPTAFMMIRRTGLPLAATNSLGKVDPSAACSHAFRGPAF